MVQKASFLIFESINVTKSIKVLLVNQTFKKVLELEKFSE